MRAPKSKIKILSIEKTRAVLFFESQGAPDYTVLKLLNRMTAVVSELVTHVIVVCTLNAFHKRLADAEILQVLFLLKRNKRAFSIENICIQKNPEIKFFTYQEYENEFLKFSTDKFIFSLNESFSLIPISIPKPWGQEIWYSGIETRGISKIQNGKGVQVPLSWIVSAVPYLILGKKFAHKDPILIKILDPLPQEVIGDLYYELHQEKNEVYVVLDKAQDDGKIKIGLNAEKLNFYHNDLNKYKTDFLNSILEYEKTRREIDGFENIEIISNDLKSKELLQRRHMDSFCGFLKLNVGDVVNVPTHVPHALQHGVKVLEFQTPTYERLIISFAQKVLTQSHWDTKRAFDLMHLEHFQKKSLKILSKKKNALQELVCKFADFKSHRWTLNKNAKLKFIQKSNYRIIFMISGQMMVQIKTKKSKDVLSGMCILIPQKNHFILSSNSDCVFLLCEPI